MPNSFHGLPLLSLIVHTTVSPRFRAWAGQLPLGVSAVWDDTDLTSTSRPSS